jgi:5-methylcytosine-specific restriction endonuclease McrA
MQAREPKTLEEWTAHNHRCKIRDNGLGAYCGYVKTTLPESVTYDDLNEEVSIHGGLTYGVDDEGWVGFDCGHAGDRCVDDDGEVLNERMEYLGGVPSQRVWNPAAVRAEVECLAEQLDAIEDESDD